MANPQKENGNTQIANELLEAIIKYDFTGSELRILLFVIRKTYGFHKKVDKISISQFQEYCDMPRQTVVDCLKRLVRTAVLVKDKSKSITQYGLQKNYDLWLVRATVQYETALSTSTKCPEKLVRATVHTKENTKEIQKKGKNNLSFQEKYEKFLK